MSAFVILSAVLLAGVCTEQPAPSASEVNVAVRRGLNFLATDAKAWRSEHKCVSCHHAAMVVWAMASRSARTGDEGAKNLVPIIGAGSAWAVLGLLPGGATNEPK